ncbi:MAG: trypsin-like peptidase domain-containing protein [Bdellovibrionales bacterium]|nr:trypsin-like peptidase domain-containing protein [Bdellovibrionales bacterium]
MKTNSNILKNSKISLQKILRPLIFFLISGILSVAFWQLSLSQWSSDFLTLALKESPLTKLEAQVTDQLPKLKEGEPLPHDLFIKLGKLINPAVVNISTTYLPKQFNMGPRNQMRDPFFDLFEQFMGPRQSRPAQSLGTGFVIREDGLILTNNHVIDGANIIKVQLDEKTDQQFDAKVIGRDANTDVALIKIETKKRLAVARLGTSSDVQVGEWIAAFGNPFGHGHTMTKGIVSAIGREIDEINLAPFIQVDASINPGNSGGPLVNTQGLVIGINTAIDPKAQGIGFSIPIDYVKTILPQLEKEGGVKRGFIGIHMSDITEEIASYLKLKANSGAMVVQIVPNSPAQAAGLKEYDIITEVDGQKIKSSHEFQKFVARTSIGKEVSMKVIRNHKIVALKVKVGNQPSSINQIPGTKSKPSFSKKAPFYLGFSAIDYSEDVAQQYDIPSLRQPSPIVVQVDLDSPAERVGLAPGDVILDVNMKRVTSVEELYKSLKKNQNILRVFKQGQVILIKL